MHYRGTIWRPPFEADSVLLQVTSGCTHNKCKFCSLYEVSFRMSPLNEIEEDLYEFSRLSPNAERVFMTGANPLVLSSDKLIKIFEMIHKYLPKVRTIGGFARITDIAPKSAEELAMLHKIGLDGISIGTETGDDDVLEYMNKGYYASDIITQCKKLEAAGISYNITYLTGLAGENRGEENAVESAKVYSLLKPKSINVVALTMFPNSMLYSEIKSGRYIPEGETEKLKELHTFISRLKTDTVIFANTVSNAAPFAGRIPRDKQKILDYLEKIIKNSDEKSLNDFRSSIRHL